MADSDNQKMVGRHAYFPPEIDERIRVIAFWEKRTKSDLISILVQEALVARGITDTNAYIRNRQGTNDHLD